MGPKCLNSGGFPCCNRSDHRAHSPMSQQYPLSGRRADGSQVLGYLWLTLSHEVEQQMPPELNLDLIGALTGFSVGTLDGRDAMMVIEIAANAEDFAQGIRPQDARRDDPRTCARAGRSPVDGRQRRPSWAILPPTPSTEPTGQKARPAGRCSFPPRIARPTERPRDTRIPLRWIRRPKSSVSGKVCRDRRHPPREALGLPDPRQRPRRIGVDAGAANVRRRIPQTLRQIAHVADREVQSLGAGGRNDVSRIAGQEQTAEPQRLGDETTQRRDDFSIEGPVTRLPAVFRVQTADEVRPRTGRPTIRRPFACAAHCT